MKHSHASACSYVDPCARLARQNMHIDQVLTHIHGLSEGGRLVVRRLPDAGVHHEDDQVLQEVVASLHHKLMTESAASCCQQP